MKKINRNNSPSCLGSYRHGLQNWTDVNSQHKNEIWAELEPIQNMKCAYCERSLTVGDRHIEHFLRRSSHPQLTFTWTNIFGSCNDFKTCGKNKDSNHYDLSKVLKPDLDDPDCFLVFNADGSISCKNENDPSVFEKYQETVNCFNLDSSSSHLRAIRKRDTQHFAEQASFYTEMAIEDPQNVTQWKETLQEELDSYADYEFYTTIRHIFRDYGPEL